MSPIDISVKKNASIFQAELFCCFYFVCPRLIMAIDTNNGYIRTMLEIGMAIEQQEQVSWQ